MATTAHPTAIFNLHHKMNAVRVENISERVSRREVVALFSMLIGEVLNFTDFKDAFGGHLEITFHTRDAATKALCMSGYTVGGTALAVTASSLGSLDCLTKPKRLDGRRNLYILGLPFALTKTEFSAIFSRYGTVSHCVILATVDNASRRRGFVVMSTHEEAKLAMTSLTRTQIKGNTLDISWAVVQRSQGFLDGGDRTMLHDSRSVPARSPDNVKHDFGSANSSDTSISSNEHDLASLVPSPIPTSTLLVTNLPTLLFSQMLDLHPLLYPFGQIKKLEVLESSSQAGNTSAVVEYASIGNAKEAKETLQGQCYANYTVNAEFLRPPSPLMDLAPASNANSGDHSRSSNLDFNPFVPSFAWNTQSHVLLGNTQTMQHSNNLPRHIFSEPQYSPQSAPHPSYMFEYCPPPRIVPRSSFATSTWSNESSQYPSLHGQYAAGNQLPFTTNTPHSFYPNCYA